MNRYTYVVSWITIASAMIIASVYIFWMTYPYRISEFSDSVLPVENKIVKQGESLRYSIKFCKYMDIGATVTKTFVDGLVFTTPTIETNNSIGCHNNLVYSEIPKNLPTGMYTLQILYRYKVNPVRTIDIIKITEPFLVTK